MFKAFIAIFATILILLCPLGFYTIYHFHDTDEFEAYDHMASALKQNNVEGAMQDLGKVQAVCSRAEGSRLKRWCKNLPIYINDFQKANTRLEKDAAMTRFKQAYSDGDGVRTITSRYGWWILFFLIGISVSIFLIFGIFMWKDIITEPWLFD